MERVHVTAPQSLQQTVLLFDTPHGIRPSSAIFGESVLESIIIGDSKGNDLDDLVP